LLGTRLAVVFQDAGTALNPSVRIGRQVSEKAEVHLGLTRAAGRELAVRRLTEVRIPHAAARARQYPHEYSGGMRQRAMIAMGLATEPALVIADEPTTALDVTVQAEVLSLLRGINEEHDTAIMFVSHDLAVISELCTRVVVMYAGRIVETLPVGELAGRALHPYTRALRGSVVDLDTPVDLPLVSIPGRPPHAGDAVSGCPFAPRCPLATARCREEEPVLEAAGAEHTVACWVAMEDAR
jgi:oligopeptide/dipeptide ABC transporter ATP-binding protein